VVSNNKKYLMLMNYLYYFTVFIPTYNRAHTLGRLFDSLERQTFKDFEIIIVDDGSKDETKIVVDNYIKRTNYDVRYFYQNNKGKPYARNFAIEKARGMLFKTIDSDDLLTDDCLEQMKFFWESIDKEKIEGFAGVIGLCADYNTNEIVGDKFPSNIFDSNHIINRTMYKIKGDKTQCIRTDIMKNYLFPIIENEKFIPEGIVWNRISLKYKFRYVNKVMMMKEYLRDGISMKSIKIRASNCKGSRLYYQEYINEIIDKYNLPFKQKIKAYINYIRFSLHCRNTINEQIMGCNSVFIYILAFFFGFIVWLKDIRVLKK
jgi:glycosyltransferase involved in cell wall biosynthesis